jgi:hypothetical protein
MAEQNQRQPIKVAWIIGAALLLAAALVFAFSAMRSAVPPPSAPPPSLAETAHDTPPAPTNPPAALAATQPAAVSSNDLARMKTEFSALMQQRAGLKERARACSALIAAARRTDSSRAPHANDPTAVRFREAAQAVERALDAHPRILALQALYNVAETDKVAVSKQQSRILDAWQDQTQREHEQMNDAMRAADQKAQTARQAIFEQAGVKRIAGLSPEDQRRMAVIQTLFTNEIAQIKHQYTMLASTTYVAQARQADGSSERFEACNTRYEELARQQDEIKKQQLALRTSLRKEDPAIASRQAAAVEASRLHQVAVLALPEVAEARAFLDGVDAQCAVLDRQARVLRKTILAAEPAYGTVLEQQAAAAGLAMAGEEFWNVQG